MEIDIRFIQDIIRHIKRPFYETKLMKKAS